MSAPGGHGAGLNGKRAVEIVATCWMTPEAWVVRLTSTAGFRCPPTEQGKPVIICGIDPASRARWRFSTTAASSPSTTCRCWRSSEARASVTISTATPSYASSSSTGQSTRSSSRRRRCRSNCLCDRRLLSGLRRDTRHPDRLWRTAGVVHPQRWKRELGVPAGKDGARARASQLLPQAAGQWPLKKHDGRAEAALISVFGSRSINIVEDGGMTEMSPPARSAAPIRSAGWRGS